MAGLTSSSVGKKFLMATSAMFLLIFLLVHLVANLLSIKAIFGENAFNVASDFMGYNPFVQFLMQPVLGFAVILHFVMGFVLEIKNKQARPVQYGFNNRAANSTWASRNMIISGAVILAFLVLHVYDFWVHEFNYKVIEALPQDSTRYWGELHAKFADVWRVALYVIAFVLLGMHLSHGFHSAFQSVGANSPKCFPMIKKLGKIYAVVIPAGFIIIALYHFFTN
ncbi:succinate dehydrogenase cytochrome b subunit [Elizabethkingia sp. JS20170427COW]|uniref:succinate dehydrogenase cytochrome b subunit n=1 Tax=Elizabethkingia sp. JS20170427COW TaxID=2583851 RepID=UPI001110AD96|nr:succinate dehydrogenase cytochrome b subunit [Elizabethkingia sp. JS20170427COW]QCX53370.1 succinate dehydrogenase cytochrome b subunit [Elizabethkingia sp. JS20170427COW]